MNLKIIALLAILMITACNPLVGGYGANTAYYPPMNGMNSMGMNPGFGQQPFGNGFNAMPGNFGANPFAPAILRGNQPCQQFNLADRPDCVQSILVADNAMMRAGMPVNTVGMMNMGMGGESVQVLNPDGTTATPGAAGSGTSAEIQEIRRNVRDISRVIAGRNPQRRR